MSETVTRMAGNGVGEPPPDHPANEVANYTAPEPRVIAEASEPPQTQQRGVLPFAVPDYLQQERDPTPALNKAIADVLAAGSQVQKRGENKFQGYKYATADDLREHVARLLGTHGLSYEHHEVDFQAFNKLIMVRYLFRISHSSGERGPFERVTALAAAMNKSGPDDKAFSKAHTLALKDWVKSRFSIGTGDDIEPAGGDDPDRDDRSPSAAQPPRPPAQRTPARGTSSAPASKTTTMQDVAREATQSHAVENHDYAEEAGDPGEPPPASTVIDPDEQWVDIELAMALRAVKTIKAYDELSKAGTEVHTKMSGLYERNKPLFDRANGMFAAKRKELTNRIA